MSHTTPFFENVQTIYDDDHSDDLLALFLDEEMVYSCAYFERDDMTLAEAQLAKIDLSLGKCDLSPGQTLLDIGCGYGACAYRAATKYGVNVIGLTLSEKQARHCREKMKGLPPDAGKVEIRLAGWEEFDQPVDRIVSIGAFEHFRRERFAQFFETAHRLLPADGRMMLHTIVAFDFPRLDSLGIEVTHENVLFGKFIQRKVFPGGQLFDPRVIEDFAAKAGFRIERAQSLQLHYARTLETWAAHLQRRRDEAVAIKGEEGYEFFMKYLTGCAAHFRSGHIDVVQFTMVP